MIIVHLHNHPLDYQSFTIAVTIIEREVYNTLVTFLHRSFLLPPLPHHLNTAHHYFHHRFPLNLHFLNTPHLTLTIHLPLLLSLPAPLLLLHTHPHIHPLLAKIIHPINHLAHTTIANLNQANRFNHPFIFFIAFK